MGSSGSGTGKAAAGRRPGEVGWVNGTAVVVAVLSANSLRSLVVLAGTDAVLVDLLADEAWHCFGVVLETGCGAVRLAGASKV